MTRESLQHECYDAEKQKALTAMYYKQQHNKPNNGSAVIYFEPQHNKDRKATSLTLTDDCFIGLWCSHLSQTTDYTIYMDHRRAFVYFDCGRCSLPITNPLALNHQSHSDCERVVMNLLKCIVTGYHDNRSDKLRSGEFLYLDFQEIGI